MVLKDSSFLKQFIFIFLFIFFNNLKVQAFEKLTNVDSFRNQFVENVEYCEHYSNLDTLKFLKDGYYSFVNYDNSSSFYKVLFCFEDNFMNLIDPDHYRYPVEELYRVRDIRWIFLFYLERYIFNMNSIKIDKFCRISVINLKTKKELDMWGGNSGEDILMLFQKLIRSTTKKNFKKWVIDEKRMSPMEFIGYKFVVSKTKSAI